MITINLFFCGFFVWIPTYIYPPAHKNLKEETTYLSACIISIVPIVISVYMWLGFSLTQTEKINSFIGMAPITFLILYKQFDKLSLEEYKRNIYFSRRYVSDEESKNQTGSENFFQWILFAVPVFWIVIGWLIFK
jgi:hypothetical protein